jgi:hypothetical protein
MRTDIGPREDDAAQTALLEALAAVGAAPEDDSALDVPLPTGLHRFRAGTEVLTVFVDAWLVDLEGPDELVKRVLESMAAS